MKRQELLLVASVKTQEEMEVFEGIYFPLVQKVETYLGNEISHVLGEKTITRQFQYGKLISRFIAGNVAVVMEQQQEVIQE